MKVAPRAMQPRGTLRCYEKSAAEAGGGEASGEVETFIARFVFVCVCMAPRARPTYNPPATLAGVSLVLCAVKKNAVFYQHKVYEYLRHTAASWLLGAVVHASGWGR